MRTCTKLGLAALVAALPLSLPAADWPQWRGPDRSGVSRETGLLQMWPKGGPRLVWTYEGAGTGFSGPAIVGGRLYIMGARQDTEFLLAVDDQGKEAWSAKIGPVFDFKTNAWSRGPNATPTVDGELVYGLGSQGDLVCVKAADGKEVWRRSMPKELGGEINPVGGGPEKMGWGYSWSPLVEGDLLICAPGGPKGLLAALDKKSGKVRWRSKESAAGKSYEGNYSSPVAADIGGVRQIIQMTQEGAIGVSAKDGSVLWTYTREDPFPDVVCPTPIVQGNQVYLTAWGGGATLLTIEGGGNKFKATEAYQEKEIANRHGGVVLVGKYVYGYHEVRSWDCQEFASGRVKWAERGRRALPAGTLSAADGLLYCLGEQGEVALLEPNPAKYVERSRFTLPRESAQRKSSGKVWVPPVIANGRLYLRDQELVFCYKIK
jgi:outer membrane protein assembly factor BamB